MTEQELDQEILSSLNDAEALKIENDRLRAALKWLVQDVQDYEAWQRPCAALDAAKAALEQ